VYQVVRDHFETFRRVAAELRDRDGLPRFVEEEFRALLRCGLLAGGFARFHCDDCGHDRLVPFSCKGRAVCASCGGRRMAERAAHLVDQVLPAVPIRQWVLTLPYRLRYRLAWDHDLCKLVARTAVGTILGFLQHQAREAGVPDGRGGAVAIVQRCGSALNLNPHLHLLVLDGVFVRHGEGIAFWSAPPLTALDVAEVLATIVPRVRRRLERRGTTPTDEEADTPDLWAEAAPGLAGLAAASVQGRVALGPRAGGRPRRCGTLRVPDERPTTGPAHARQEDFDLHAATRVPAHASERLDRLCRYVLRPPVAQDRLAFTADGQVRLQLTHPWADGTTHLLLDPIELLERLAVIIPRPRINLILYHGVLGARAAWRALVVANREPAEAHPGGADGPRPAAAGTLEHTAGVAEIGPPASRARPATRLWADLMRRSFGLDTLACPHCGGRLRLIALIDEAAVLERILRHLHLPTEVPTPRPGRAPPLVVPAAFEQDGGLSDVVPCH
jgi:hypothetical protein